MRQVVDHYFGITVIVVLAKQPFITVIIIFSSISPSLASAASKGYISSRSS